MKRYLLCLLAVSVLYGCQKEQDTAPALLSEEDQVTAEDIATMEIDMSFVDMLSEQSMAEDEGPMGGRVDNSANEDYSVLRVCGERIWERLDSTTRKLTIDFGDEYCQGPDGLWRKGRIVILYYARPTPSGMRVFKKVVSYQRYFVNRRQLGGRLTITFQSRDQWTRVMENGFIIHPDSSRSVHNYRHEVLRVEGGDTREFFDDVLESKGGGYGIARRGNRFRYQIQRPLVKIYDRGCMRTFVAGVLKIDDETGRDISLNYDPSGNAPCDHFAALTIDGVTRRIELTGFPW